MEFVEVKENENKKNGEVRNLLIAFMASDVELAEVKNWEDTYKSVDSLYQACVGVVRGSYKGKIKVTRNNGRLFIERIGK